MLLSPTDPASSTSARKASPLVKAETVGLPGAKAVVDSARLRVRRVTFARPFLYGLYFAVVGAVLVVTGATAATVGRPLTVAIVGFPDASGATNLTAWEEGVPELIRSELGVIQSLRVLPASSVAYGRREMGLWVGPPWTPDKVRQLGRVIGADVVLTGNYRRTGDQWCLTVQTTHVAGGESAPAFVVRSANLWTATLRVTEALLREVKIRPTAPERRRMRRSPYPSPEELYSQAS